MEVVEEPSVPNSVIDEVQVNVNISDESAAVSSGAEECFKPNGVAETGATANIDLVAIPNPATQDLVSDKHRTEHEVTSVETAKSFEPISNETAIITEANSEVVFSAAETATHQNIENQPDDGLTLRMSHETSELFVENTENVIPDKNLPHETESLVETNIEPSDTVTFKTEVLVERNENDLNETDQNDNNGDAHDASKYILSDLRQNLELSDVLHSEVVDNMENNNSSTREEVLNKEELLDILEGNDVDQVDDQYIKIMQVDHVNIKTIEAQLALQQLTRLKSAKTRRLDRTPRKKRGEKKILQPNSNVTEIKDKKEKKPSEICANESGIISENKGKKDKKNSGTTSKALDSTLTDKINKKDKKVLETTMEQGNVSPCHQQNKSNEVEPVLVETKTKRNRKTVVTTSKVSEVSLAEKCKKEICNSLVNTDNAETSQTDESEIDGQKSNSMMENIVNVLVKDWEDDEHEPIKVATEKLLEETEDIVKSAEELATAEEVVIEQEGIDGLSMDSSTSFGTEGQAVLDKSGDESQPQRRLGRVIKKKVIFDPDNPDTFTKGKLTTKIKEIVSEKEPPISKKVKTEVQQRPKSKSPTGKLHWKKPPPKANKQNKRLTEVDKLLMDEGAVNMIYQLTPEAPKGKKNMRTKAEFIKKIQSSTPDGKEMKFRERKKESIKVEEGEAKKITGGKQRGSLNSSVKSMTLCEDFEAHSADDSIIYRRHSSSSYSSNCMSPLRVNDPDSGAGQGAARVTRQASDSQNLSNADEESVGQSSDQFMSEINTTLPNEIINKSDCMSIKQKLNSKLSHVLNKRKRESIRTDKPAKQKRVSAKQDEKRNITIKNEEDLEFSKIKSLMVTFDHNLAEICVKQKTQYSIQTLKELDLALAYINSKEDIAVTLLTSECGTLCSSLDLSSILVDNMEIRTNNILCFAECIRSLMSTVSQHSKLLCTGVWGACWGVGLALAALSDVAVASERASFALDTGAPLCIAAGAITHCARLPKPLIDKLVVFGRQVSAEEAQRGGLVSRVLWPDRFAEHLRDFARDTATQPTGSILLKKQLLTLSRGEKTFQSCLEAERDLLAEYWKSDEAQELIRATLEAA